MQHGAERTIPMPAPILGVMDWKGHEVLLELKKPHGFLQLPVSEGYYPPASFIYGSWDVGNHKAKLNRTLNILEATGVLN